MDLPDIVDLVAERPERFIVFCDDLSFDEGEPGYKALKSILDGSVAQASDNVLIYATSNRRHLLPGVHEGEPVVQAHRERRGPSGRGGGGEDPLSERFGLGSASIRSARRVPGDRRPVAAHFGVGEDAIREARQESLVWRSNAARAPGAWRTSSRATTAGGMRQPG